MPVASRGSSSTRIVQGSKPSRHKEGTLTVLGNGTRLLQAKTIIALERRGVSEWELCKEGLGLVDTLSLGETLDELNLYSRERSGGLDALDAGVAWRLVSQVVMARSAANSPGVP
jgi:hypothetical protein